MGSSETKSLSNPFIVKVAQTLRRRTRTNCGQWAQTICPLLIASSAWIKGSATLSDSRNHSVGLGFTPFEDRSILFCRRHLRWFVGGEFEKLASGSCQVRIRAEVINEKKRCQGEEWHNRWLDVGHRGGNEGIGVRV